MKKTKRASSKAADPVVARRLPRSTREEIDDRVVSQAEDDSAWEAPVQVSREARRELGSKPAPNQ